MEVVTIKKILANVVSAIMVIFACMGCRSHSVVYSDEQWIEINSRFDATPDSVTQALLQQYKMKVDSIMSPVIGYSATEMWVERPESPLSNFAADVLMDASGCYMGALADVALVNFGGLRSNISQGEITVGNIYETFAYDNAFCIVSLTGEQLYRLFQQIAGNKGEGISGASLVISSDGRLLEVKVGGAPLRNERLYTVATLNYLAEGNDGLSVLAEGGRTICPEEVMFRSLVFDYIEKLAKKGKAIDASVEGRVIIAN